MQVMECLVSLIQESRWLMAAILYCMGFHAAVSGSQEDTQGALVAHIYVQYNKILTHDIPELHYIKTLVAIMHASKPMDPTKGLTTQYKRSGGYEHALQDFDSLQPKNVKDITKRHNTGKVGQLPDGRMINVRMRSSMSCYPTLEIQNRPYKDTIKFRYGGNTPDNHILP